MRAKIQPEQQIQRINQLLNKLETYREISNTQLNRRPSEKSWSITEVMKHISIAHNVYREKISTALKSKTQTKYVDGLKCSAIPSYLIKRFPPVEGKIRFKMKTGKKFQPVMVNDSSSKDIIIELKNCLEELKSWVNHYRTHPIALQKFNSAIGPIVRFNVPEACEFILCHNERHFHQMENAKNAINT